MTKFTDPRDGQSYKTIKLNDGNEWFAENLRFEIEGSLTAKGKQENWESYGRFYTWRMALAAIPAGWFLPSKEEWRNLFMIYGGFTKPAYDSLAEEGESGFNALLGGIYNKEREYRLWNESRKSSFWSSTLNELSDTSAYMYCLCPDLGQGFVAEYTDLTGYMLSVRCVRKP